MRRGSLVVILIIAAMACGIAGQASAATATANLSLSLNVPSTCTVATSAVNFGSYASAGVFGNGAVTVKCTDMTGYSVALNAGGHYDTAFRNMDDGSNNHLQYLLYKDAALSAEWGDSATYTQGTVQTGIGLGTDQVLTVYGWVTPGATVPAGAYSDTVQVTVTY